MPDGESQHRTDEGLGGILSNRQMSRCNHLYRSMSPSRRDVALLFRNLGCQAEVNTAVQGARAINHIDVWVRIDHWVRPLCFVVECKDWDRPIPKEVVASLHTIIGDLNPERRGWQFTLLIRSPCSFWKPGRCGSGAALSQVMRCQTGQDFWIGGRAPDQKIIH